MSAKQRIYDKFADGIRSGKIATGARLPTEKKIAAEFSVSRSTVQAVMMRLANEGMVTRKAGSGTFAARIDDDASVKVALDIHNIQSFESEMAVSGDRVSYRLVSYAKTSVPQHVGPKIGVPPGAPVMCLYRLRFIDEICIGSEVRYLSPEITWDVSLHALETQGGHQIVEEGLGLRIGRIDAALRSVCANTTQAEDMGISVGAPLLVRSHTILSDDEQVILHGESYYVEPFSFRYTATVAGGS
ncbi:GntR family transcriptional regulator [uncultured Litoreibacter sp.]|uniref:GntR family transcriptional regulator n=1 Tax=uncultured Litoreibacter sp. TaxID=1392394 RepID=UPI0026065EE5|nr:GntR family transcriptional regulator [uncultured Litoreibacter sp.]